MICAWCETEVDQLSRFQVATLGGVKVCCSTCYEVLDQIDRDMFLYGEAYVEVSSDGTRRRIPPPAILRYHRPRPNSQP